MATWTALWLSIAHRLMNGPSWNVFIAVAAVFTGIIASDGISGFLHWFCDTFLEETTPVIGVQLIAPFREHHRDPLALTRHGFLELCGNSAAAFLSVLTPVWWLGPVEPQSQSASIRLYIRPYVLSDSDGHQSIAQLGASFGAAAPGALAAAGRPGSVVNASFAPSCSAESYELLRYERLGQCIRRPLLDFCACRTDIRGDRRTS